MTANNEVTPGHSTKIKHKICCSNLLHSALSLVHNMVPLPVWSWEVSLELWDKKLTAQM